MGVGVAVGVGVGVGVAVGVGVGVGVEFELNVAVSVMGPFIVIEAGLDVPEKEPVPLPVQLLKVLPWAAVAVICPLAPLFLHPLAGVTLPPVPAFMVRKYWVVNLAV